MKILENRHRSELNQEGTRMPANVLSLCVKMYLAKNLYYKEII